MNAPEDRGHRRDVRCKTAFLPKAEVHPRSCYVAQVPTAEVSRFIRLLDRRSRAREVGPSTGTLLQS